MFVCDHCCYVQLCATPVYVSLGRISAQLLRQLSEELTNCCTRLKSFSADTSELVKKMWLKFDVARVSGYGELGTRWEMKHRGVNDG